MRLPCVGGALLGRIGAGIYVGYVTAEKQYRPLRPDANLQKAGRPKSTVQSAAKGFPFSVFSTTTGWAIIFCLVGAIASLQPFNPLADLRVLGKEGFDVRIAQVFGYESTFILAVGAIFASLFLLLIATSFIEPVPLWRPFLIVLAGMVATLTMGSAILPKEPRMGGTWVDGLPTSQTIDVLGKDLKVTYTAPTRVSNSRFQVSGRTTRVKSVNEKWNLAVTITFVAWIITALSFGLLLLGAIQLRGVLMRQRLKPRR